MSQQTITIDWTSNAKSDVRRIYFQLLEKNSIKTSKKIRDEIISAPKKITFPEQFQVDEYIPECRRIVIRNYKVLYSAEGAIITILSVFNSHRHPSKMKI